LWRKKCLVQINMYETYKLQHFRPALPDFSWYNIPKWGKYTQ
jgi:hypothetical protein